MISLTQQVRIPGISSQEARSEVPRRRRFAVATTTHLYHEAFGSPPTLMYSRFAMNKSTIN